MFDSLLETTLEHHDLESFLLVFDRGYLNYERFRQLKPDEIAFITPLKRNILTTPVSRIADFHVHDDEPRRVIDEFIELSDTTETWLCSFARRERRDYIIAVESEETECCGIGIPPLHACYSG